MRVCGEKRTIALNCSLAPPRCYRTCIRALLLPYVDDLVAQRVRAEAEALGLFHKLFVDGRKGIVDHDHSVLRVDLRIQPAWHEGKGGREREREREREVMGSIIHIMLDSFARSGIQPLVTLHSESGRQSIVQRGQRTCSIARPIPACRFFREFDSTFRR